MDKNDLHNTFKQNTNHTRNRGELMCFGRVSISCFTINTRRVTRLFVVLCAWCRSYVLLVVYFYSKLNPCNVIYIFNEMAELICHYMFILFCNYNVLIKDDDLSFILQKAICAGFCYRKLKLTFCLRIISWIQTIYSLLVHSFFDNR